MIAGWKVFGLAALVFIIAFACARLLVPGFWGAVSIVAMWLAVLFDSIFGGDMIFANAGGGPTIIPSAVLLGLFAVIGTASIAKRVFGRRDAGWSIRDGSTIRAMRHPAVATYVTGTLWPAV